MGHQTNYTQMLLNVEDQSCFDCLDEQTAPAESDQLSEPGHVHEVEAGNQVMDPPSLVIHFKQVNQPLF